MLAYLPASGHPANPLFFRLQMNTGLRKWETTQKMRSASYPTPAELDAYAKKIANRPLSIQIYPNTVKVPQRKHIRRTVNGLDTSLLSQRHSPYLFSSNRGLLAVFRAPVKGVIKELDGSHIRQFHKVVMNPPGGMYRTQSTLNLSQPALHLQSPAQSMAQVAHKQNLLPPQTLQQQQQQSRAQPGALPQNISDSQPRHQVSLSHSEARQQDKAMMQAQTPQQQRLTHRQGTQSLCHTEVLLQQQQQLQRPCPPVRLQQHLFNLPTCKSQPSDQQLSFTQQAAHQDLHHIPDEAALLSLPPADELLCSQPPPQAACAPPKVGNGFQPQQAAAFEQRKPPDADVPPNVTVSTSTIPLSMASNLHQNHPGDLSSIVHQINQLCQARAGMGATSVCEGQIANPSPISRNLLINCLMVGHSDKALAQSSSGPLHPQPNVPATISIPTFQRESEKVHVQQQQQQQIQQHLHRHQQLQLQQLQQQQQQLQQQQQQQQQLQQQQQQQLQQQRQQQLQQQQVQRSWSRPQLSQEQDPPEGVHPCKNRRLEPSAECSFSSQNINYSNKLANTAHSLSLKRHLDKARRSSSATCQLGSMPCTNGPLVQPLWAAAPGGHQDLPLGFQGAPVASSADGTVQGAAKYKDCTGQSKMMRKVDFFGRPVQVGGFQDHSTDVLENVQQGPAAGPVQTPGNVRILHTDHQGFC